MKIAEFTTDEGLDVLCEITTPLGNIVNDQALVKALQNKTEKGLSEAEYMLKGTQMISEIIPVVLKTHRDDLYHILGALNKKSVEEIGSQSIIETVNQIKELMGDKDLQSFFKRSDSMGKKKSPTA